MDLESQIARKSKKPRLPSSASVHELLEGPVSVLQCDNGTGVKHETSGNLGIYKCPYPGSECQVTGDVPFLATHLRDEHNIDIHTGSSINHKFLKTNPPWMLTVFDCYGEYFCLYMEAFQKDGEPVYKAFVQFMGDEVKAGGYRYYLEVVGEETKLAWQGPPRSIGESHKKVKATYDGLFIHRNVGIFSSDGQHELALTGRIFKG